MRIEVLSDHPGARLREIEMAIHDQRPRWWQLLKWLKHRRKAPRVDLHEQRDQQQAGVLAEERMTSALRALSDDWLLFRGYTNGKGEVDHLLVGPAGVWAIEVKGRAATIHADGDLWWFEKFDRYGNRVEQGKLADGRGRSWGRQVTDIAGALQEFLSSRGTNVTVRTAVVVIHDRARLGTTRNLRTMVSVGTDPLMKSLLRERAALDTAMRERIAQLIRRDHEFHAARRKSRR
jgi:hypothetical protein